jgi:predicted transcriptional regulator
MNGKEITRKIKRSGHKVKDIAESLNVRSPFVSQVIHSVRPTKRIRQYIADLLGESVETLWPEEDQA